MTNITVLGGGFVGLTTATVFAQQGHRVAVVDVSPERREALLAGRVPFFEPGLTEAFKAELASGRLRVEADTAKAVAGSEMTFLCVGTPSASDGRVDLKYVQAAAEDVGRALKGRSGFHVVVVKSTVPPGTADTVVAPALERTAGGRAGEHWGVASNPEFLKEGMALKDAQEPDRVVVGTTDAKSEAMLRALYESSKCPKVFGNTRTAEMTKYAANSFLAVKISFANEMANLCEEVGVDWYDVMAGIGHDPRIGPLFLRPGVGFGGSCFPKDLAALKHVAREHGKPLSLVEASLALNERQPLRVVEMLEEELGDLRGKRIALLGLAFKADTDDVRETRALPIWKALVERGADVVCHDPMAMHTFSTQLAKDAKMAKSAKDALAGADACVLQTEWKEYRALAPADFAGMKRALVIDGRRVFDPKRFADTPVAYRPIGLGRASTRKG